ncbi:MAG: radical SAM protein [Candidatus Peribacteraceae bacterium]
MICKNGFEQGAFGKVQDEVLMVMLSGHSYLYRMFIKNLSLVGLECEEKSDDHFFVSTGEGQKEHQDVELRETLSKEEIKRIQEEKLLRLIEFNITNTCQLRCPGCYKMDDTGKQHEQRLPFERYQKYIEMGMRRGLRSIWLLGGEPTMHPQWKDFLCHAKDQGIDDLMLFSNMLNLQPADIQFFIRNKVKVVGKLNIGTIHAPSEDELCMQAAMIGRTESVAQTMLQKIKMILDEGLQDHNLFALENLLRGENIEYAIGFWQFCRDNHITPNLEMFCDFSGQESSKRNLPSDTELKSLVQAIQAIDKNMGFPEWEPMVPHISHGCSLNYTAIGVDPNEDILPCAASNIVITNTAGDEEIDYEKILCNPVIQARRNLSKDTVKGVCNGCDKFDRGCSGGCRNAVEAGRRDPYEGYPDCIIKNL